MKHAIILFSLIMAVGAAIAQKAEYWVFFTDKNDVEFNPYAYFDAKAIERRLKTGIPIDHKSDYPLNNHYKECVAGECEEITGESRWFNAIAVLANSQQINNIQQFPFVKKIRCISSQSTLADYKYNMELNSKNQFILKKQIEGMQGQKFTKAGVKGKGIRIAIFDAGFPTVDKNPVFEHIRKDNRILKTYDFVKEAPFVYDYNSHGTSCMSCICGVTNGQMMGLAPDAEFLLARTEKNTEPYSEEVNWMQAMEWADKNGADIISSSLGYTHHRYFIEDMDGKKSLVTRAANMAAAKGMVVVNSMGNEGNGDWKYMGAPADADSILSIGGLNPFNDYHIRFSSFGPTADKRLKPNVCGYGQAITAGKSKLKSSFGTSFAAPLISGFVACAWQARPNLTNMELMREIEKSGHLYPYFDYAHGYGMPQAGYFMDKADNEKDQPLFDFKEENGAIKVVLTDAKDNYYKIGADKMYYHIRRPDGRIVEYALVEPYQKEVLVIGGEKLLPDRILMVFYNGYTAEYKNNTKTE